MQAARRRNDKCNSIALQLSCEFCHNRGGFAKCAKLGREEAGGGRERGSYRMGAVRAALATRTVVRDGGRSGERYSERSMA